MRAGKDFLLELYMNYWIALYVMFNVVCQHEGRTQNTRKYIGKTIIWVLGAQLGKWPALSHMNVLQFLSIFAHNLIWSNMVFQYPTHETVTFFLYNSIKIATHSYCTYVYNCPSAVHCGHLFSATAKFMLMSWYGI